MRRFKWEPFALMVLLLLLGAWLVAAPNSIKARDGARTLEVRVAQTRGVVEVWRTSPSNDPTFRLLLRDGFASPEMNAAEFRARFGDKLYEEASRSSSNFLFRLFNITGWASLVWVVIGFGGQFAFTGRMLLQWFISERKGQSVVPEAFWWLSLIGGMALFAYFVWRNDIVAVLGQSSGVVIYARNLRLIYKQRARERETRRTEQDAHQGARDPSPS